MRRRLATSLAILLATSFSAKVHGEILLFTKVVSVNRSVNIFDANQFDLDLNLGNDFIAPTNGVTLFDDLVVSTADVGATYDANPTNDPNFATASSRLTDGLNEYIKVMLTEDEENGLSEQRGWPENFFFGHVAPQTPPDLQGAQVDRVTLHIDQFSLSSSSPTGGPTELSAQALTAGQEFDLVLTLQMFGIPEPATSWLLLVGLAILGPRNLRSAAR